MGTGNGDGEESMSRIQTFVSYAGAVSIATMRRHVVYPISRERGEIVFELVEDCSTLTDYCVDNDKSLKSNRDDSPNRFAY